jgi:hypothetical protein
MKFLNQKNIIYIVVFLLIISGALVWYISSEKENIVSVNIENNLNETIFIRDNKTPYGDIIYFALKNNGLEKYNHKITIDQDPNNIYYSTLDKDKSVIYGYSTKIVNTDVIIHLYINPEKNLTINNIDDIINRTYIFSLLDVSQMNSETTDYSPMRRVANEIFDAHEKSNSKLITIQ